MNYFEVPFKYQFREYVAFVRRQIPLPYIVSIIGSNKLLLPDSFPLVIEPAVTDPFRYRYPGLVDVIADAIINFCIENQISLS